MGYWPDVNPGDTFQPNAKLENEIRHRLNALNGFGGGAIQAGNPGLIRLPVYNATSPASVLLAGIAVSIDLTGTIAGGCYPVVPFDADLPCYGVLMQDLNPSGAGDCILSGLASVQIASSPATGNYALPGTGGVFVRGDEGVPILNVSGTAAVVMLGNVKTEGGGSSAVIGFPDFSTAYVGWHGDDFTIINQDHTAPFDCWINASATCGVESSGGDGIVSLIVKTGQTYRTFPLVRIYNYTSNPFIPMFDANSILIPLKSGMKFRLSVTYNGNFGMYIPFGIELYKCL